MSRPPPPPPTPPPPLPPWPIYPPPATGYPAPWPGYGADYHHYHQWYAAQYHAHHASMMPPPGYSPPPGLHPGQWPSAYGSHSPPEANGWHAGWQGNHPPGAWPADNSHAYSLDAATWGSSTHPSAVSSDTQADGDDVDQSAEDTKDGDDLDDLEDQMRSAVQAFLYGDEAAMVESDEDDEAALESPTTAELSLAEPALAPATEPDVEAVSQEAELEKPMLSTSPPTWEMRNKIKQQADAVPAGPVAAAAAELKLTAGPEAAAAPEPEAPEQLCGQCGGSNSLQMKNHVPRRRNRARRRACCSSCGVRLSKSPVAPRLWCSFYLKMTHPTFELVPRLIGRGGCNTKGIADVTGAKVRVRGKGSGHLEFPTNREATTPLMLVIATESDNDEGFKQAIEMAVDLLRRLEKSYVDHCREAGYAVPGPGFTIGDHGHPSTRRIITNAMQHKAEPHRPLPPGPTLTVPGHNLKVTTAAGQRNRNYRGGQKHLESEKLTLDAEDEEVVVPLPR